MIHRIPTLDYPSYTMRTVLDGREYLLDFDHNQREDRFYLTIADNDGVIYRGVKVEAQTNLLLNCADRRSPAGILMIAGNVAPTLDTWADAALLYFDAEELSAAV